VVASLWALGVEGSVGLVRDLTTVERETLGTAA
jgi:hypothetical protein